MPKSPSTWEMITTLGNRSIKFPIILFASFSRKAASSRSSVSQSPEEMSRSVVFGRSQDGETIVEVHPSAVGNFPPLQPTPGFRPKVFENRQPLPRLRSPPILDEVFGKMKMEMIQTEPPFAIKGYSDLRPDDNDIATDPWTKDDVLRGCQEITFTSIG